MKKLWWLLPAALLLAGCGKSVSERAAEKAIEAQTGAEVSVGEGGGYKIKGDGYTQTVGSQAELPPGFPTDMPIYPGARLAFGQAAVGIFTLGWVSDDEPAKVKAFYVQNLPVQGWQMDSQLEIEGKAILNGSKGGRRVMLGLEPSTDAQVGGKTRISLNLTSF